MSPSEPALRIYDEVDFRRLFAWELQRATRYQDFLSLGLVRPDRSGPPTTPAQLSAVAYRVAELVRSTDLVGVIDECTIAVLFVHTPDKEAALTMERLRGGVGTTAVAASGTTESMPALSLGLASFPTDATSEEALLSQARARLELARRQGES
jgi:GGDEF domain-containing protein